MKRFHVLMVGVVCAVAVASGVRIGLLDGRASTHDRAATGSRQIVSIGVNPGETNRSASSAAHRPAPPDLYTPPDTDGLGVREFIDQLAPQARRGDPIAAMRVYRAEAICAGIERKKKTIAMLPDDASREAWAPLMSSLRAFCDGVTPAQIQERFVFLDQAVRSGLPDALLDYRREGPDGFEPQDMDPHDPRLIAWKQNANAYLERLSAAGNYDAWSIISTDYELGIVAPQDFRRAIFYESAWMAARHPGSDPLSLNFVADMAKQLPASDVEQAIREGTELGNRFPFRLKRS